MSNKSTYNPCFQNTKIEKKDFIFFYYVKITTMTTEKTVVSFKLPWWNTHKQIRDGIKIYSKTREIDERE